MKEKLFIFKTHQGHFSTTDITDIHTNTGVSCEKHFSLTHFDFLLVLIGQDVKVRALTCPGYILYNDSMVLL